MRVTAMRGCYAIEGILQCMSEQRLVIALSINYFREDKKMSKYQIIATVLIVDSYHYSKILRFLQHKDYGQRFFSLLIAIYSLLI